MLLLDVLDGAFDSQNLVVFLTDVHELTVDALSELVLTEQELRVVQRLVLLNLAVVQLVLVLLAQSQFLVLLQKDLALPLKLLKILVKRFVHLPHSVYYHHHEHVVRAHSRPNQLVEIVRYSHQRVL